MQWLQRSHILEAAVTDTLHRRLLMGHLIYYSMDGYYITRWLVELEDLLKIHELRTFACEETAATPTATAACRC